MNRYLILTLRTPRFQISIVEQHRQFLDRLRVEGKIELAGPFTDQSGGAYILNAETFEEAKAIAHQDPVFTTGFSQIIIYEWKAA